MPHVRSILLSIALLATVADRSWAEPAEPGTLIDLKGDLATDLWIVDRDSPAGVAAIRPCRFEDVPGRALLGTVRAGAIILTHDRATANPSGKVFRISDGAQLYDTAELDPGTTAGLDFSLLVALGSAFELETRYFAIDQWAASHQVSDPAGVRFDGFGIQLPGLSQRLDYTSRLYSLEINARPRVTEGLPLVLGFRALQLHERFSLTQVDPGPESTRLGTRANNYLYGLQVGAEPYLFGGDAPLRLEALAKAGLYANFASQGTSAGGTSVDASLVRASFAGELGVMIDYRIDRFLAVRAGYEALWLTGMALAPDQSPTTNLLAPDAAVNDAATAFFHGAVVSLEFIF